MSDHPIRRRKHHTIPQFLLRNFTDSRGALYEFDLDYLTRKVRTPSQVCHTKDFYTIEWQGGPSDEVEQVLSRFESEIAPALLRVSDPARSLDDADLDLDFTYSSY